jgi:uncharacterized membrane protein
MSRQGLLLTACIGIALAACSKTPSPAEPPVPSQPPEASAPANSPTSAATEPPAESSLALKRGTLVLAAQHATFRPCGAQADLWVVDQTDGDLRRTFAAETTPIELYIEAHGERAPVPEGNANARAFAGAFLLEEVLYATQPAESRGCMEAAPNYIVRASGNEPFWSVEVGTDKMVWRQPDGPKEIVVAAPESQVAEGTVGYVGTGGEHKVELFVDLQPCRDSMSGAFHAYSARAVLDGTEFKGCARIGE